MSIVGHRQNNVKSLSDKKMPPKNQRFKGGKKERKGQLPIALRRHQGTSSLGARVLGAFWRQGRQARGWCRNGVQRVGPHGKMREGSRKIRQGQCAQGERSFQWRGSLVWFLFLCWWTNSR